MAKEEKMQSTKIDEVLAKRMLKLMFTTRAFEEKAENLYAMGKIHGTMHLSIGMEASAVGSIMALDEKDVILSTHRGHGHCIAKGADMNRMMAEFMGKSNGYCRGRGGSMHIADIEGGNLGANGVVGGGLPMAVGVGLGLKMEKKNRIHLCFFGDGAASSGAFHEALNMASIYNLPIVFVCENNQYAMSYSVKKSCPIEHIADRASGYAMPGEAIDGNDITAVYHSKSDANRYRTKEEIEEWKKKDPIRRWREKLIFWNMLDENEAEEIKKVAYQTIDNAVEFAENSPEPDLSTIEEGVYC